MSKEKLDMLFAIKKRLEQIEVRGKENLSGLLGCINALEKMMEEELENETENQSK